jgi:uncharacterized protein
MIDKKNKHRILLFLAFAFGISWASGLIIYLTGGLENSPIYTIAGAQISLALILLATVYMAGPAIANLLTRLLTREGKANLNLRPHFDRGRWVYWLAAWTLPGVLTIAGGALYFLIFPGYFDSELSTLIDQLGAAGLTEVNPMMMVGIQTLQAILIAPLLNALPVFGEEFGWRGYLQPKLMPLGGRKAILLTGVIWGVWHWPVIMMGYNYGHDYFGAPFLGPLAMVWFTIITSIFLGWVTIKANSVWPGVIGHGALNGIAAISLIFIQGNPETILGPTPVGVIGGIGFTITAMLSLLRPNALKPENDPDMSGQI